MARKKPPVPGITTGALTHSPFAKLVDSAGYTPGLAQSRSAAVPSRPELPKRFPPCNIRMRLESRGRSGKVVTRVSGLPAKNLEPIASRLRRALGCGATVEGCDVILQGSLKERASEWLKRAGDLHTIRETPKTEKGLPPESVASAAVSSTATSNRSEVPRGTVRAHVRPGQRVAIVQKSDQVSGKLTEGIVRDLLTSSPTHPRGIKVRLESGQVGRVRSVYQERG